MPNPIVRRFYVYSGVAILRGRDHKDAPTEYRILVKARDKRRAHALLRNRDIPVSQLELKRWIPTTIPEELAVAKNANEGAWCRELRDLDAKFQPLLPGAVNSNARKHQD